MIDGSGPFWVAPPEPSLGGVDFLGLREPGLAMANRLLPGITNFTSHSRYYTVIAWMFVNADRAERLRLLESAFIHAVRTHEHTGLIPTVGVVGSDSVPPPADEESPLPLRKPGKRIVSVLDAAFYGPSAKTLGVAGQVGEESAFEPIARELSETVDLPLEFLQTISEEGMPPAQLPELFQLCPCEPARGRERDLLEELLFRHERRHSVDAPDVEARVDGPRRRSLAVLLDALEPTSSPERFLCMRFLDSALGREGYVPPDQLRDEALGFALVALRWCLRYSLEIAWVSFGRLIDRYSFGTTEVGPVVGWLLDSVGDSGRWQPGGEVELGRLLSDLGGGPGVEIDGVEAAADHLSQEDPASATIAASVALAMVADRAQFLAAKDSRYRDFLDLGVPWWVPVSEVSARYDKACPVRDWLGLVLERYVIGQHLLTGARKWADGKDGFFFHPSEGGYRLAERVDLASWKPDPGPTKIPTALALMRGIQLVELDGNESWRTSRLGEKTVRRVLASAEE